MKKKIKKQKILCREKRSGLNDRRPLNNRVTRSKRYVSSKNKNKKRVYTPVTMTGKVFNEIQKKKNETKIRKKKYID